MTKIATKVGTEWRVIQGKTIDGDGGYTFDDIDGDGAAELLSVDQSFLYTFAVCRSVGAGEHFEVVG